VFGTILKHSSTAIKVLVPRLSAARTVVRVNVNGTAFTASRYVPYVQKEVIVINANTPELYGVAIHTLHEGEILRIPGHYLAGKEVEITFNDLVAPIIRQTNDGVQVAVPSFSNSDLVNISGSVGGRTFVIANGVTFRTNNVANEIIPESKTTLDPFSQNTITENQIITITGNNIPENPGSVEVIFDGRVRFTVVEQTGTLIRAQVPTLVLKSGIITVKINGKSIPLSNGQVNYKLSKQ